jgi:hypothetical protein
VTYLTCGNGWHVIGIDGPCQCGAVVHRDTRDAMMAALEAIAAGRTLTYSGSMRRAMEAVAQAKGEA